MAEVFLPQQPFMATMNALDRDSLGPEMPSPPSVSRPLPSPPFVFPLQNEPDASHAGTELDSTSETVGNRRWKPRSRPQQLSFNGLPDFEFHPSPSSNGTSEPTTPTSPSKSKMVPPHSGRHRRNGSEFIGGDGKDGITGLMSTSPTKGGGSLPPPPGARTGPPAGRRGHAHRRSGAVSSHDVSAILKSASEIRGGSAPSTPSDPLVQPSLPPFLDRSISQPTITPFSQGDPPAAHLRQRSSTAGTPRPRVGFSDHIEFIPRPLSTISSETSSSLSTTRPSHSVTGSISSVISSGNASPPSARTAKGGSKDVQTATTDPSPAASPVFLPDGISPIECTTMVSRPDNNTSKVERNVDFPSSTDVFRCPPSELISNASNPDGNVENILRLSGTTEAPRSRRRPFSASNSLLARPRTSPEPKVSKRQRKVKSWAGSLLARKARYSTHADMLNHLRSPTPPPSSSAFPSDLSLDDLTFDEDTTCVIQTAAFPKATVPAKMEPSWPSVEVHGSLSAADEPSPVLDLDAALGPLNSGSSSPSFEEVTGYRSTPARRRLHSSGVTGGFDGPGMHYHRRAESAPEMAPVNRQIFGFSRLGSNSAMADVFEEEEEDEAVNQEQDSESRRPTAMGKEKDVPAHGLGVAIVDTGHLTESPLRRVSKPRTLGTSDSEDNRFRLQTSATASVTPTAVPNDQETVDIVNADEEPRATMATKSSNGSTATPALASDPFSVRPASAPMQFMLPTPSPAFATPEIYSSALSTPDFSQSSFEGPRLHTASSSITDRGTLSSFRGEHCFDVRPSVDDVPSLTSSASTMTSAHPPRISSSAPTRTSTDRPSSLSGVAIPRAQPGNASKRSSLASLSRLVGGSHGGKSKLSTEERTQPDDKEKNEKKKGHRISRLMRFWKSKERISS
ncbi:MAG: hypothetical protein Q9201_001893 [Fulgogasparrea decipioides]